MTNYLSKCSLIVAHDQNRSIGRNNKLPWSLPEDLKWFREKTLNNSVIMGMSTFRSIRKKLPLRTNIVVSSTHKILPRGVLHAYNLRDAYNLATLINPGKEVIFIGGESIYKQVLPYVNTLYITEIYHDYTGDRHFPEVNLEHFKEIERIQNYNEIPFDFITYKRIDNEKTVEQVTIGYGKDNE